jgi:hypothetical protein
LNDPITAVELHEFRNSGQDARIWKRRIALLAKRGKDTLRTLQFPLDIQSDFASDLDLKKLTVTYNAIEGTGTGTLFDYWIKLHMAGFRFFPSAGQATISRQQSLFDDAAWNQSFCEQSGNEWTWFIPSKLFERFTKTPREVAKKGGSTKSILFIPENVANECHVSLTGASIKDTTPAPQREFFLRLGTVLAGQFESWKSANADLRVSMQVIDSFLKTEGINLPSLRNIADKYAPTLPEYATIAWSDPVKNACLNVSPSVFAQCAARYPQENDSSLSKIGKFVQIQATTPNVTALSWLFGKGLEYFRTVPVGTIIDEMDVPKSAKAAIQSVKDAALALPEINIFSIRNYSPFRPNFGGKIDSWIANYSNRLLLLKKLIAEIEPGFEFPHAVFENNSMMSGIDMNATELKDLVAAVYANALEASRAVDTLLGQLEGDIDAAIVKFELFSQLLDSLAGAMSIMSARYDRLVDIAGKDQNQLETLLACKFLAPNWCKPLSKLVSISGGLPDVELEIQKLNATFADVRTKMQVRYSLILSHIESLAGKVDVYAMLEARELEQMKKLKSQTPDRAHVQARRAVLHRIGRAVQNCSEKTKHKFCSMVLETGVFETPSYLKTFIFNQKGAIYRAPFDRARNRQYRMDSSVLLNTDWLGMVIQLSRDMFSSKDKNDLEDALRLERTALQLNLSGIPVMDYPSSLAIPDIDVDISASMSMQLSKPLVSPDLLQRAFNLYCSALSGLVFKQLRKGFVVKMRFGTSKDTQLIYASKDKNWNIPQQYKNAETGIGIAARLITSSKPAEMLAEVEKGAPEVLGEFMRQAPHDWFFDPVMGGNSVEGRAVEKGEIGKSRKFKGYRLVGAPSYKSVLDKSLLGLAGIGRSNVIIEIPYTQTTNADFTVSVTQCPPRITLSIPVTERITATEKDESMLFNRFVAIDLGERGLGYAVFDAKTMEKIASGHVMVKDISNLVRRTQLYEQRPNVRQKFQAKFNVNLSELRENTVGSVCHHINRLCAYYCAFPVIEYMVPDKLNKQVKSVYEAVSHRYLWSSTNAHTTARVQFWLGGQTWEHPFIKTANDNKPLLLSPGRGVSGKGTSQRCSCCGRNPFDILTAMKDKDKIAVLDGKARVNGAVFKLFERAQETKEGFEARRRQNKNATMDQPLAAGNYTVEDLRAIMRKNLRRAPTDRHVPDTTVSRYHCVFADCGHKMHADENAAINIGQKFRSEVVVAG